MSAGKSEKAARLATIIFLLKANKSQTAEELSRALKVTVRTIYRDIETLTSSGVPIQGTQGRTGGYVLTEYYPVDPFVYSSNDALGFFASDDVSGSTAEHAGQAIDTVVRLLADSLPARDHNLIEHVRKRFFFDMRNWFWRDPPLMQFSHLKEAIMKDQIVEIIFTERGRPKLNTEVFDAYGLVWRQGHWYFVGFSHSRKTFERHRIQRVLSVRPTGKRFVRQDSFELPSCWMKMLAASGKGSTLVRLRIEYPATLDFEFFAWKKDQAITKHDDHWIVPMHVDNTEWLIPLALSYGGKVEVLEPLALREQILGKAQLMLEKYARHTEPNPTA